MRPFTLIAALSLVLAAPLALAQSTCQAKQHEIERQLDFARLHGNTQQAAGLERALSENRRHCSNAQLEREQHDKVVQLQQKVRQRETALHQAERDGRPDKIAKQRRKLDEAQTELRAAQRAAE